MRLVTAIRLSPGTPLRKPGQWVDVDEDTYERLSALGVLATDANAPASTPSVASTEDAEGEGVPASHRGVKRPIKAASAVEWKAFAEAKGLNVKGLSKQQIIAAINK